MNEAEIQAAMTTDCVFCERIMTGQVEVESDAFDAVAFAPNNPVTEGHILVVPREHASNAMVDPRTAAKAMMFALVIARGREEQCNIITSCGPDATQTIMHTHIHLVPRREGDELKLPWTDQIVEN